MPLGLILGIGRAFRRKRTSSLDILSSKRAPRDYYKGKNCKSTGFHTRKGGYVLMQEKLPNYVVPDLTDVKWIGPKGESYSSHTLHLWLDVPKRLLMAILFPNSLSCLLCLCR
ncbi:PREDICTED: uncharacterized protein LOC18592110 isoform X1 [Theobroma cacao]|uniref:Uncharacterized protein LOC18592110 isoform X1 n=1 Tax=Theobroma cacao TaxID=3641 RepID=A0AB32WSB1_THECC|nr:PREDICTED: uncharacterized protein LOC18592110 isoform X1 [Theobroma cacao]